MFYSAAISLDPGTFS